MYATDMDHHFQKLHGDRVARYQEELERARREAERADSAELRDERVTRSLRESGIDVDYLLDLERESQEAGERFVERIRPPLVERSSLQSVDAKRRALYHGANQVFVPPYAATLLAPNTGLLKDNDGESGQVWVLPYDPSELNIKAVSSGSGWGCLTAVGGAPPPTAVMWFNFVPERSGLWWLIAYADLHGFHVMRADDSWYNCKSASFNVDAIIDVEQFDFWHGAQRTHVMGAQSDNISDYHLVDTSVALEYLTPLRAGDPVWVALTIEIDAFAQGGGSFAEINFADGAGNYIKPYGMFIMYQDQ